MYYGMDEMGAFAAAEVAQPGDKDFIGPLAPWQGSSDPSSRDFIGPPAPQSAGTDWSEIATKAGAAAQGLMQKYQQLELDQLKAKLAIPGTIQVPQTVTIRPPAAPTTTNKWLVGGLVVAGLAVAGYAVWSMSRKKASNPGLSGA